MNSITEINLPSKYRPKSFTDVIGQSRVVRMLEKYIEMNLHMPIVLNGQYGCGKTTLARIFATHYHPAEEFSAIWEGRHPGVVQINAANKTGVKDIEALLDTVKYQPIHGINKIYIIDEAHTLSRAAYNAFLETLEFMPQNTKFIFATTEKEKIIDPLLSRCFVLNLNSVSVDELKIHLQQIQIAEGIIISADAMELIAEYSNGSVRDGMKYLEQAKMLQSGNTQDIEEMLEIPSKFFLENIINGIVTGNYHAIKNIEFPKFSSINILIALIKAVYLQQDQEKWIPVLQAFTESIEIIRFGIHSKLILQIALYKAIYVYKLAQGLKIDSAKQAPDSIEHTIREYFSDAEQIHEF